MDNREMLSIIQLVDDTLHIVVVGEIIETHIGILSASHIIKAFNGVSNFKEIVVVAAGPQSLV